MLAILGAIWQVLVDVVLFWRRVRNFIHAAGAALLTGDPSRGSQAGGRAESQLKSGSSSYEMPKHTRNGRKLRSSSMPFSAMICGEYLQEEGS